jgi:hypothetical protein
MVYDCEACEEQFVLDWQRYVRMSVRRIRLVEPVSPAAILVNGAVAAVQGGSLEGGDK